MGSAFVAVSENFGFKNKINNMKKDIHPKQQRIRDRSIGRCVWVENFSCPFFSLENFVLITDKKALKAFFQRKDVHHRLGRSTLWQNTGLRLYTNLEAVI